MRQFKKKSKQMKNNESKFKCYFKCFQLIFKTEIILNKKGNSNVDMCHLTLDNSF